VFGVAILLLYDEVVEVEVEEGEEAEEEKEAGWKRSELKVVAAGTGVELGTFDSTDADAAREGRGVELIGRLETEDGVGTEKEDALTAGTADEIDEPETEDTLGKGVAPEDDAAETV